MQKEKYQSYLHLIRHEGGYFHLQATKPDTIGFALNDSPLGLGAIYFLLLLVLIFNLSSSCLHIGKMVSMEQYSGRNRSIRKFRIRSFYTRSTSFQCHALLDYRNHHFINASLFRSNEYSLFR